MIRIWTYYRVLDWFRNIICCVCSKVIVDKRSNRTNAPQFYTEKLGFVKKLDISLGVDNSWLIVVAKEEQNGTEVLLEPAPNHFEPTKVYSEALFDAGILVEI